jgi:hypothetical protein
LALVVGHLPLTPQAGRGEEARRCALPTALRKYSVGFGKRVEGTEISGGQS